MKNAMGQSSTAGMGPGTTGGREIKAGPEGFNYYNY